MKSTLTKVPAAQLQAHPGVGKQRVEGVHAPHVSRMAAEFNPAALGVLTAVREGDQLYVIDGAHRLEVCKAVGWTKPLDVRVLSGDVNGAAARLFIELNTNRKVSPISHFVSAVAHGDPAAVELDAILKRYGWTVRNLREDGNLSCIAAARAIHAKGDFERVIKLITATWGHRSDAVHQNIVNGVALLVTRFGAQLDDEEFTKSMRHHDPVVVVRQGKGAFDVLGGTVASGTARTIVKLYNQRRRTKLLPEWVWTR